MPIIFGNLILFMVISASPAMVQNKTGLMPWQEKTIANVIILENAVLKAPSLVNISSKLKLQDEIRTALIDLWQTTGHCLFAEYIPNPSLHDLSKICIAYLELIKNNPATNVSDLQLAGIKKGLADMNFENPHLIRLYCLFFLTKFDLDTQKKWPLNESTSLDCMTTLLITEKLKPSDISKFKAVIKMIDSEINIDKKSDKSIFGYNSNIAAGLFEIYANITHRYKTKDILNTLKIWPSQNK